jgi:ABC-type uncharacterized transport system substrate-binding protein
MMRPGILKANAALACLLCLLPVAAAASLPSEKDILGLFSKIFPDTRSIGVIYSEDKHEQTVGIIREHAAKKKIEVKSLKVSSIKEFSEALNNLKGAVDTIWVLDDSLYSNMEVWKYFVMFTMRHRLKTIVHSEKALSLGGLFYCPDTSEVIINKRVLDLLGVKVKEGAGPVKYYGEK